MSELMRRVGDLSKAPAKERREVLEEARAIINEAKLAALKVDGELAVTRHIMEEVLETDRYRRELTDDPNEQLMLIPFLKVAHQKVQNVQRGLYDPWGM